MQSHLQYSEHSSCFCRVLKAHDHPEEVFLTLKRQCWTMHKLLLDTKLYHEIIPKQLKAAQFSLSWFEIKGVFLIQAVPMKRNGKGTSSSLIHIFQQFPLLTSNLPENIYQLITLHLVCSKQNALTFTKLVRQEVFKSGLFPGRDYSSSLMNHWSGSTKCH